MACDNDVLKKPEVMQTNGKPTKSNNMGSLATGFWKEKASEDSVMPDLYRTASQLERARKRLKECNAIDAESCQAILDFVTFKGLEVKDKQQLKIIRILRIVALNLAKPVSKVTRPDLEALLVKLMSNGYSRNSMHDVRVIVKAWFAWYYKTPEGSYPDVVNWIKPGPVVKKHVDEDAILSEEDIRKVIGTNEPLRNRVIAALLWETALRIGELNNLRVKDFFFDPKEGLHFVGVTDGKTAAASREVPVSDAFVLDLVKEYLEKHPQADEPGFKDSLLFQPGPGSTGISHNGLRLMLKRLLSKAGLANKPSNPHHFRHSRLTLWAEDPRFGETQLYFLAGHEPGSGALATYLKRRRSGVGRIFRQIQGENDKQGKALAEVSQVLFRNAMQQDSVAEAFFEYAQTDPLFPRFIELVKNGGFSSSPGREVTKPPEKTHKQSKKGVGEK